MFTCGYHNCRFDSRDVEAIWSHMRLNHRHYQFLPMLTKILPDVKHNLVLDGKRFSLFKCPKKGCSDAVTTDNLLMVITFNPRLGPPRPNASPVCMPTLGLSQSSSIEAYVLYPQPRDKDRVSRFQRNKRSIFGCVNCD